MYNVLVISIIFTGFLSWFENRCKNNMSQQEWDEMKSNILEYFV